MVLSSGTRFGPYEILSPLGAGGMGAVYKARDTRLDRLIAIKILPPEKLKSPDRHRRFIHEARAASALNHPNIVTIYDIAVGGDLDYIAMEYVPGHTLEALIGRGALRIGDALEYARQAAGALAAAHAAGILHRDLKPANIMVTDAGVAKVLDFGLAKWAGPRESVDPDSTLTLTAVTQEGHIVGTIAYMSPEQAEGKNLDFRSDIFSFGAVLYEMLTGRRAFTGSSPASTLSAVLRDEPPPAAAIRGDMPADLDKVIARCLRKDPARRVQTMADVKVAIEDLLDGSRSAGIGPPPKVARKRAPWWPIAVVVLVVLAAVAFWVIRGPKAPVESPMSALPLTGNQGLEYESSFSPDGNQVAYAWNGEREDNFDIYVKLIGPGAPLRLTTSPDVDRGPAWSPDGRSIAFVRMPSTGAGSVMLVPALGGPERKLADIFLRGGRESTRAAFVPRVIAWAPDSRNLIVAGGLSPEDASCLFLLSVATGQSRKLTASTAIAIGGDGGPALSPDGRTLAFFRGTNGSALEIFTLALTADLQPAGEPRQITFDNRRSLWPAWTADGREIVYTAEAQGTRTLWRVPANGSAKPRSLAGVGDRGAWPAISPRGNRLVYSRPAIDDNIWRIDFSGAQPKPPRRVVASTLRDVEPRLSPDGSRIAFASDRTGHIEVWTADSDGSNQVQLTDLKASISAGPRWSPDGHHIVFLSTVIGGQQEIFVIPSSGGPPRRLTENPAHDTAPAWSHDGNWIYFGSNRSGDFQIWMMPFTGGEAVQLTKKGGYAPLDSTDGRFVYFARRNPAEGIWRVPAAGGQETRVILSIDSFGNFAVADHGIYFVPPQKGTIQFYDFATRLVKSVARIEKPLAFGLTATADGRTILFAQTDREVSELILVENFH
jgi:Tol biopolymer transport system component/serine/threonine protein kinase